MMKDQLPPDPDDQLFLLLQSMGYVPNIPLWKYQQSKRAPESKPSSTPAGEQHNH